MLPEYADLSGSVMSANNSFNYRNQAQVPRISVYWPLENSSYPGTIDTFHEYVQVTVNYGEEDIERRDLSHE